MKLFAALALTIFSASIFASDSNLEAAARKLLQEILNDADSAKFLNLETNEKCIWGKVNAKNSHGGYVGFKNFAITIPSKGKPPKYDEAAPGSISYLGMCVSRSAAYELCLATFSKIGDRSTCAKYKD
jgi:hypothetical protein